MPLLLHLIRRRMLLARSQVYQRRDGRMPPREMWRGGGKEGAVLATVVNSTPASLGGPSGTQHSCSFAVPGCAVNFNLVRPAGSLPLLLLPLLYYSHLFPMPPRRGTEMQTSQGREKPPVPALPQGPHTPPSSPQAICLGSTLPAPH